MAGVRLFLATSQQDLIYYIRANFSHKPYIESIISVPHPKSTQSKLDRSNTNLLLWDMDLERHDTAWVNQVRKHHSINIIYTSHNRATPAVLNQYGKDTFIAKPAIFTPATSARYLSAMEKLIDNFILSREQPLSIRDLPKTVMVTDRQKIIVIAASTGGTNALEDIIKQLPVDSPPIVVVQHMSRGFTKLFAERLDGLYKHTVKEAESGDFLMRGCILLAPADKHIRIVEKQGRLVVECFFGTRIHGVMPAADILFESVAEIVKNNAIGIVLTGMGTDGARGLKLMRNAGCKTIGQNEATCVVYGMPKAAKDIGAIEYELPLAKIPEKIMELVQ